jgi:Fur family transcriptional regulator, ferric uptake regulator
MLRKMPSITSPTPPPAAPSARDLLQQDGERITAAREAILDILLQAPRALTHPSVEQEARARGLSADRVTVYRVLDWLVAHGYAHRIAGEDRVWRFNAASRGNHGHAHFHCQQCGQVFCLNDLQPVFSLNLPEGFRFEAAELTIQGLCPQCSAS